MAGGAGGDRGWDGRLISSTQWTWIWANSKRQRRTEEPGVLHFKGLQRVRLDLSTKQQQSNPAINQYQSPLLVLPQDHPLLTAISNCTLVFRGHHLLPRTALLTSRGPIWTVFFLPFSGFCIPKRHPCYQVGCGEKRPRHVSGRKTELIAAF